MKLIFTKKLKKKVQELSFAYVSSQNFEKSKFEALLLALFLKIYDNLIIKKKFKEKKNKIESIENFIEDIK